MTTRFLTAVTLAVFLFFASGPTRAEAPMAVVMAFNAGLEVGCYRAVLRWYEAGGLNGQDCIDILDEYGAQP